MNKQEFLYEEGLKSGQNQIWAFISEILKTNEFTLAKIFGFSVDENSSPYEKVLRLPPQEALRRWKLYKETSFEVGEIVHVVGTFMDGMILSINGDECELFTPNTKFGHIHHYNLKQLKKLNRKIDFSELNNAGNKSEENINNQNKLFNATKFDPACSNLNNIFKEIIEVLESEG